MLTWKHGGLCVHTNSNWSGISAGFLTLEAGQNELRGLRPCGGCGHCADDSSSRYGCECYNGEVEWSGAAQSSVDGSLTKCGEDGNLPECSKASRSVVKTKVSIPQRKRHIRKRISELYSRRSVSGDGKIAYPG